MSTACTHRPPYFVVTWGSRRLEDMKRVQGELEHAVRKSGEMVIYVGVMTRTTEAATDEFRAHLGEFAALRARVCRAVYLVFEGDDARSIVERATVQTILREHHLKPAVVRSVADLLRIVPRALRDGLRQVLVEAGLRDLVG